MGFTLVYTFNTAIGRMFLTMPSAYSSRYMTLVISGLLAICLELLGLQTKGVKRKNHT